MQVKERIEKIVGKENVLYNENMSKHTTFKTGGPAEIFVKVDNIEKLKKVLETAKEEKEDIHILGNGSNLLVKDNGVKGIVIRIDIEGIKTEEKENKIIVKLGAGEKLAAIGQRFMQNNISGFEELSGIPGTLGGAVRMNAGAHGKEIKDVIKK